MIIRLIWVGKNKDTNIKRALDVFIQKITPYSEIIISEIPDLSLSGTNNPEVVIRKEGDTICKYLDEKTKALSKPAFIICLDSQGVMLDSMDLAHFLEEKMTYHELIFIIGGVYGLAAEVKKRANLLMSLSRLTFTHQMVRIILLEQIYRTFTIIHGKKYHY